MSKTQPEIITLDNDQYVIKERFESKKNKVYLVFKKYNKNEFYVLKEFNDEFKGNLKIEVRALKTLNKLKIPAPNLLFAGAEKLLIEYKPGKSIMNLINETIINGNTILDETQKNELETPFLMLGAWFAKLHTKTLDKTQNALLKGDCVLKNFIFNPMSKTEPLIGLDFEESIYGPPLLDLGNLAAIILTIKPIFTEQNFWFFNIFMNSYDKTISKLVKEDMSIDINSLDLSKYASQALTNVSRWHNKESARELISWAEKLKKDDNILKKYFN